MGNDGIWGDERRPCDLRSAKQKSRIRENTAEYKWIGFSCKNRGKELVEGVFSTRGFLCVVKNIMAFLEKLW